MMTATEVVKFIVENTVEGEMGRVEVFRNLRDIDVINFIRDNG